MNRVKATKLGLVTLFSALAFGTVVVHENKVEAAPLGTELQYYLNDPTPEPVKFLNIWNTNGYALQPESLTNVKVGENQNNTLHTDAARSVWSVATGVLDAPHYRWYKSDDGKTWSEVPESQNGHRKNFTFDTSKEGTTWYQLDTQYWNYLTGWLAKTHIYSNIAQVNVLSQDVNPESVKVSIDNSYLYNVDDQYMNTTYAHASVNPTNATGKLTWSIGDSSLATIDSTTGKITANSKGLGGKVKVTATFTGSDNDNPVSVAGTSYVTIGGGLNSPTVNSDEAATFKLQGDTDGLNSYWDTNATSVEWYRKGPNEKDSKAVLLGLTKTLYYTTVPLTKKDNGYQYRAKIIMNKNGKKVTLTTGWSTLTVK